jgi:hypothetical protein
MDEQGVRPIVGEAEVYAAFIRLARALALMPMFGHDEEQLVQLRQRGDWIAFRRPGAHYRPRLSGAVRFQNGVDFYRKIGRKGARVWNAERKRRKAAARHAALARWGNNGNHPPK